jgi:wyosine [tRNA(Phe)-imidazoG37] synthetase (radical SAM superfamily)
MEVGGRRYRGSRVNVLPLKKGIIYGPVDSRRLGKSLGVNLSPVVDKLCSFNCIYCHFGWTERLTFDVSQSSGDFPSKDEVFEAVRKGIKNFPDLDYITFSGNGEPTLHPDFKEVVIGVKSIRDEIDPGIPLAILSNSSMLRKEEVREVLSFIEVKIFKLDAGTEELFQKINKPAEGITLERIVSYLKKEKDIVIQTVFIKGSVDNTTEENITNWSRRIKSISPEKVQIYSTDRPVPEKGIEKVGREELKRISERVERETGISIDVFSLD